MHLLLQYQPMKIYKIGPTETQKSFKSFSSITFFIKIASILFQFFAIIKSLRRTNPINNLMFDDFIITIQ